MSESEQESKKTRLHRWGNIASNIVFGVVIAFVIFRLVNTYYKNSNMEGKEFANFPVTSVDGATGWVRDFIKTPAVLSFWNSSCVPCLIELSRLNSAIESGEIQKENFVAVNIGDDLGTIRKTVDKKGWRFLVLLDHTYSGATAIDLMATPTHLFVDSKYIIKNMSSGIGIFSVYKASKFLSGK